ncbi:histidine phosphatase family protein [Merismopedia glauca]|uniref:Histidine phosphatase family protein n=1 Tax=Merismopedia glauca CCAP 1448/3 TaxID=1296344 RepID=A0A2T1C9K1_9CYAN|nr:histidine phosphatase family protein [Merismopedia glauca]PSB04827.1 histidine phosphatase family protein [Merismopedia glauca CCAP 1448/3]
MVQTVWLARHANRLDFVNPDWFLTAKRRYDPPLSDDGMIQAYQLAQRLRSQKISQIFVSPFLRTIQTAHTVATILNLEVKIESGLSEWLNSDWMTHHPETAPLSELKVLFPRIDTIYRSKVIPQYPETEAQVLSRAGLTAKLLAAEYTDDILLLGHSASVAGCILGLSPKTYLQDIKVPLCSLFQFVYDDLQWVCELKADTNHLDGGLGT